MVHNDPSQWTQGVGCGTPLIGAVDAKAAERSRLEWFNARTLGAPRIFTTQLTVASLCKLSVASNARVRRELGWTPKIPFEQSLAETMAALQELRATEKARG